MGWYQRSKAVRVNHSGHYRKTWSVIKLQLVQHSLSFSLGNATFTVLRSIEINAHISRQRSDIMVNTLTKKNYSKFYQACPIGSCTNQPVHLSALEPSQVDLIITPYLTGLHMQGVTRGCKYFKVIFSSRATRTCFPSELI